MKFLQKFILLAGMLVMSAAVFATDSTALKYGEWCSRAGDCLPLSLTEAEFIRHDDDRAGWKSTGNWFQVMPADPAIPGLLDVCRFWIPWQTPPQHRFAVGEVGCELLATSLGTQALEGIVFQGFPILRQSARSDENPCGENRHPVYRVTSGGDATYQERLLTAPDAISALEASGWSRQPQPLFCAADSSGTYPWKEPAAEEPVYPTVNEWRIDLVIVRGELVGSTKHLIGQWSVDPTRGEVCSYYECRPLDPAVIASSEVQEARSFVPYLCEVGGRCLLRSNCVDWRHGLFGYVRACQPNELEYWLWGRRP